MQAFNKTFFKFLAGFVGIIALSLLAFSSSDWWEARQEQKAAEKIVREMEQRYREDTYGGTTPEETLQLFIDALKASDIELASKYFVLEKQEEVANDFKIGKENGIIELFIDDLVREKSGKLMSPYQYRFTTYDNGMAFTSIDLILNTYSGIWKIESL